jgi:phosphoglucomutase/phosphopentomutase
VNAGPGYNQMNDLVVLQTCQGLVRYLDSVCGPEKARSQGIVVGYDHRALGTSLSSLGFAKVTAAVFVSQGYKVYVLENFVATPLVAYATTHLNTVAGIMVTASHNPKQDDGYKVYWGNGAQIIPPHDIGIASCIDQNLQPWQKYETEDVFNTSPLVHRVTEAVANSYFTEIKRLSYYHGRAASLVDSHAPVNNNMLITYTAMHGVGYQWVLRSFDALNIPAPSPVEIQTLVPDPTFPTVSFPNPEEKGALNESMKYADSIGSGLILANDPDADRSVYFCSTDLTSCRSCFILWLCACSLAVAEVVGTGEDGRPKWHVFSGMWNVSP